MVVGLLMLPACQGSAGPADTTGSDNVVLHLASIDAVNVDGHSFGPQTFVDSLASVSAGRLTAQVAEGYGDGSAEVETTMVKDIAAGRLDGGWPALRAFAAAGIPGLKAVEAPMTITSYAAEIDLVSGPVADHLLGQLTGTGVVGLGLIRGPLRRPFAAQQPLLSPADWVGAPFRVFNSPVQAEVVSALGATPVNVGANWIDSVMAGTLRGAEFNVVQYWSNGLTTEAGNVTSDVVLWPRPSVLSLSQQRYDSLTEQQQQWVREASRQAVQAAGNTIDDESFAANQLCLQGVRFFRAGPDQIRALHSKVQPVIDALAADPTSGPLLKEIQAIAANHPTTDVPVVAAECATAGGTVTATGP
jgi:TRAP-type C4-dicarboxylate transport system substrate-binding protein